MSTTTTPPTAVPIAGSTTNFNDHTIGHCRAQRHSLYCCPHTEPRTHVADGTIATNLNDHTIGHCRAQRQEIYCYPHADLSSHQQNHAELTELVVVADGVKGPSENDDGWNDSKEELERWGMEGGEVTKKVQGRV
jgi:hypothetical protein